MDSTTTTLSVEHEIRDGRRVIIWTLRLPTSVLGTVEEQRQYPRPYAGCTERSHVIGYVATRPDGSNGKFFPNTPGRSKTGCRSLAFAYLESHLPGDTATMTMDGEQRLVQIVDRNGTAVIVEDAEGEMFQATPSELERHPSA